MASLASFSPLSPSLIDPFSEPRWGESFDDAPSTNAFAGVDGSLDFNPEDSTETSLCGCVGGCRFLHGIDDPWRTEDYLPLPLKKTEPLPHTLQEVEFDWDEDTPGIVWYSATKRDEVNSVEVDDVDGHEDEDEDEDEVVNSAEEAEETSEPDSDSDLSSDLDDNDAVEGGEASWAPALSGATPDDVSEEENVTEDEGIIPTTVSDLHIALANDGASPTPQSEWPPHDSEDGGVDQVPSESSLKSRLRPRPQKRSRSDKECDDDGDNSGDYHEQDSRPKKKPKLARSPKTLARDAASSLPESMILSASRAPRIHGDRDKPAYRVCKYPVLPCGFPGCKVILRDSDDKSLAAARRHFRNHFKRKNGSWGKKGSFATCGWKGCGKKVKLQDVQCQRHLEFDHFGMRHVCLTCPFKAKRLDVVRKHEHLSD